MSKIYVPTLTSNSCVEVLDKDTIRVYEKPFTYDSPINYTDYYINSHYIERSSSIVFGSGTAFPTCISSDNLTTDYLYRNDLADIMVVFFIISIICFYFPYRIFARAFGRWLKI